MSAPLGGSVSWHQAGAGSFVVELKADGLPTLHRYFVSEKGARECAEKWSTHYPAEAAKSKYVSVSFDDQAGVWVSRLGDEDAIYSQGRTREEAITALWSAAWLWIKTARQKFPRTMQGTDA